MWSLCRDTVVALWNSFFDFLYPLESFTFLTEQDGFSPVFTHLSGNPLLLHDHDIRGLGTLMNSLAPSCRRDAFQLLMSGAAHILAQCLVEVRAATILDALDFTRCSNTAEAAGCRKS